MSVPQTEEPPLAADLLAAARAGDGEAFNALVGPHLHALHVHAYRMLGSLDDADEAVQDALLSAWRALDSYRGPAPLSHWLYRITTTGSLKVIRARARRPVPAGEIGYLQPYPDRLLDQLTDDGADPAAVAERRESVALAFITALQRLPARQRAALILRDVLAWNATGTAALLDISASTVNSAVQRARAALSGTRPAEAVAARRRHRRDHGLPQSRPAREVRSTPYLGLTGCGDLRHGACEVTGGVARQRPGRMEALRSSSARTLMTHPST